MYDARMDARMQALKLNPPAETLGGVIACMSSIFRHKSTGHQVDDESPPVAVGMDLLPRTWNLLPLKSQSFCESCRIYERKQPHRAFSVLLYVPGKSVTFQILVGTGHRKQDVDWMTTSGCDFVGQKAQLL
ncbi:hypothetical protein ILYODFUR_014424 [Ilyodon furcidens]|uniref:Uncharacterized protein n=1 Tax=Ilyodon furcidens TaxID=33524 RepID=A0ABV0UT95_9TELE